MSINLADYITNSASEGESLGNEFSVPVQAATCQQVTFSLSVALCIKVVSLALLSEIQYIVLISIFF